MATILIVEDHAMSRQILVTLLEFAGHRILEAAEGEGALALACSGCPDLIICDILLPTMDGREFVRRLRTETAQTGTPVIFYTAWCRHPEDIRLDEALKPCRIIPKPSESQEILRTVNELLGVSSGRKCPQPQAHESSSGLWEPVLSASTELQFSVLMDLGYSMVAERDPNRLLNTFCRAVCEMLNCKQSLLAIREGNGVVNYYRGLANKKEDGSCREHMIPPEDILKAVTAGHKPIQWGKSMLAVPFASPTCLYGWISVMGKPGAGQYTRRDEEIIMTMSTQAALAYENILLVEQLKKAMKPKAC